MSRSIPGLTSAPADHRKLTAFPGGQARGERFRAHRADLGPWWFAPAPSTPAGGGRFDLNAPHGTCYVANDIEAAVRERLGPRAAGHRWIPDSPILRQTMVSVVHARDRPTKGKIANTTHAAAARWVTREISTILDYSLTQGWATAFRKAGFAGVRYEPRFSTGHVYAEGWFGPQGAHDDLPHTEVDGWSQGLPIHDRIKTAFAQVLD